MRAKTLLLILLICPILAADDLEKTQKKALEAQVKTMTLEADKLEKGGQLSAARSQYAESQGLIEVKEVSESIKRLDDEIKNRVKDALGASHKLYDAKKYKEAAAILDGAMQYEVNQPLLSFDLALCYFQMGERDKAFEYLTKAKTGTVEPKQRARILQLQTMFGTGEAGVGLTDSNKDRILRANHLADSVGLEASLEDEGGAEQPLSEGDAPMTQTPPPAQTPPPSTKTSDKSAGTDSHSNSGRRASLCDALTELKPTVGDSPSETYNLANCSEANGRTAEAVRLLQKYLETTPKALDGDDTRARIVELNQLLSLPGQNGVDVRLMFASANAALSDRKYDRALAGFTRAGEMAPDFAVTKWKLGLLYEALGNVDKARENFARYKEMISDQGAKDEAELHVSTLEAKKKKYDEEVDAAGDIIADLYNRGLNLTFNESADRSALRGKRAQVKNKNEKKMAKYVVGGFAIPYPYAQQQLGRASDHLQIALALFPLGAEANQLMGQVFLQANDGASAMKCFDVVASQGLPVAFYAELRTRKVDQAVKVELNRDRVRLIYLSSYDKKGNPAPPSKKAGEDGLGDLMIDPESKTPRQFDSLEIPAGDIKKVETNRGMLKISYGKTDDYLSPIYLPSFTPIEGPQARRFANNYTRLFVRYPGLEDSKLGVEGMTGGEKFKMGMSIATASLDIAMGGFNPIGAIASIQDAVNIARTIQAARVSVSVTFASWEKSADDQQRLLAGRSFKAILTQPVNLAFVQEIK